MTLTFAYIDGRFALHVADRRISIRNAKTGASQKRDDDAVKIVSPRASLLFSYTGAADLPHASAPLGDTVLWLRDRFDTAGLDAQSGMSAVAAELTAVFNSDGFEDRTLTVTITGWESVGQKDLQPWAGWITNRHHQTGERLPNFYVKNADAIDPLKGAWMSTGVPLSDETYKKVDRGVQGAAPETLEPEAIANIFLAAIRRESTPKNGVSANAVAIVYPHAVAASLASGQSRVPPVIATDDGRLMRAAYAITYVPESVKHFSMIDPRTLDASQWQQIISASKALAPIVGLV